MFECGTKRKAAMADESQFLRSIKLQNLKNRRKN